MLLCDRFVKFKFFPKWNDMLSLHRIHAVAAGWVLAAMAREHSHQSNASDAATVGVYEDKFR